MKREPNPNKHPGQIPCVASGGPPCPRKQKEQQYKTWEEAEPQRDAARELGDIFGVLLEDEDFEDFV